MKSGLSHTTAISPHVSSGCLIGLLLLCCVVVGCRTAQPTFEAPKQTSYGETGLNLQFTGEYQEIVYVDGRSPAAREQRIRVGDEIIAITIDGLMGKRFISTFGMTATKVSQLLVGEPGSRVRLRIRHGGRLHEGPEYEVELRRASKVINNHPDFGETASFSILSKTIEANELRKLRQISASRWALVRVGMSSNTVVKTIGKPLTVRMGRNPNEVYWEYESILFAEGAVIQTGPAVLRIDAGSVAENNCFFSETSGVRQKILSR